MITNTNILNRVEMAIKLTNSFLKSNCVAYDAVDLAMEQFGLEAEEQSSEIFDLICRMMDH
jgi:hypothetical protein